MLRTVAGFGRPNNHREVNQRMAKTDARSPRTERGTIALQDASQDIWDKKYRLKSKDGTPVDASVDGTWQRVARALADVEEKASREHWYGRFLWALRNGAIPAGRIISNAGALGHKPATSTINCTVSGTIQDSMDNILEKVHEAGLTLKAGCGIGYEFSTLRPRGAYVSGAGAYTSGPLSFMDIYDKMCFTVSSAGGRRGAQMGTFDVSHPDVREFIRAKREDGRLRQFNLSLLITDQFMQAVEQDADWPLVFPVHVKERDEIDLDDPNAVVWREWPIQDDYVQRADGLVACKVYGQVRARHLWDMIMVSTYDYAEPGFILIDRVNELNNNWWCEAIRATNPCGEQPLPPYGSCLLGSVNLTCFVEQPFGDEARFDWDRFREVVRVFTRMLDNVVEINGLPLEQQRQEILGKRRHGMGFLGLGSTLTLLKLRYGSPEACVFTEEVAREMALVGWEVALELAREKGPAPILAQDYEVTAEMLRKRPEMAADGYKAGDRIRGSVLHAKYSRYMQRVAEHAPELIEALAETGARFTHHSSIAPTGTISLSLANNASNGIEPSFAHHYSRNLIREGRKTKEKVEVYSYELLAYRTWSTPRPCRTATTRRDACRTTSSPPTASPRRSTWTSRRRRRSGSIRRSPRPPTCPPTTRSRTSRTSTATPGTRDSRAAPPSASIPRRSRACWSRSPTWRRPATASNWRTAAWWSSRATSRSSTTVRSIPPPTSSTP